MPAVLASIKPRRNLESYLALPFPLRLANELSQNLSVILVLVYLSLDHPNGLSSIGFGSSTYNVGFLLTGSISVYFFFVLFVAIVTRITRGGQSDYGRIDFSRPDIQVTTSYRTPGERLMYLMVLTLGVLAEELVYRGYLVLFLGRETGALALCAVISILLSVIIHLYQGRSTILFHFLFAILVVSLAIGTKSILLPVGIHLYANISAAIHIWISKPQEASQQSETQTPWKTRSTRLWDVTLRLVNAMALLIFFLVYLSPTVGESAGKSIATAFEALTCRQMAAYQLALKKAQLHPDVLAVIGRPVEPATGSTCSFVYDGETGTTRVELKIPVVGPSNSGVIHLTADKTTNAWKSSDFYIEVEGRKIDLLTSDMPIP